MGAAAEITHHFGTMLSKMPAGVCLTVVAHGL